MTGATSPRWSVLQAAILEQREQRPDLTERERIAAVARGYGLTVPDVLGQLERATDPLPAANRTGAVAMAPATTAELTDRATACIHETYNGARRGGHAHFKAIRLAARRGGVSQNQAEAVLNEPQREAA